ncbi:MAG TPA: DNA repair protein [Mogibacterium sp.]|nr:DNA repair protein [Mogibacterium sp.]
MYSNLKQKIIEEDHIADESRVYIAIDLKSFYASVECVERGLDPMTTDLVVADPTRTEKTICLAVSPSLKAKGVSGRARVFEIPKHLKYIMATPRMQLYIEYAVRIYKIYLDYFSPQDIHVYSIDEVFIDVTDYLKGYERTPKEMAIFLMQEILDRVGVRAAAGIGTNMYLAKIALDITAKKAKDFIGYLDQETYICTLWEHKPLTDFWRIGPGTARKLEKIGITTMRDITKADEDLMYKMFGIDAELIIDHAWGVETATIADIKGYKNKSHSISRGQVLMRDYSYEEGELIVKEMTEQICLEMTKIRKVTANVSIAVGYSNALKLPMVKGSVSFTVPLNASTIIVPNVAGLYRKIVNPEYPVRRVYINFNDIKDIGADKQINIFELSYEEAKEEGKTIGKIRSKGLKDPIAEKHIRIKRDEALQTTVNSIKRKFGKNAVFRGMDLEEAATTLERNRQIGGHKE